MAFFGEACVEVVAVVITFLCVIIMNYVKRRSEATSKSFKKLSELEGAATEGESLDSLSSELTKCGEKEKAEEKEMREFTEVAQRMAGRMAGLLEQLEEEEKEMGEFNEVAQRMAGRLASVLQNLVEVDDEVDESVVHSLERDGDVDASTDCSAEASVTDDDDLSEEDMDNLEWDDASFRMGRIFEKFAEDEQDEQVDQPIFNESTVGALGPRFSSTSDVPAWEILESYGVLGAPIGTWRSSRVEKPIFNKSAIGTVSSRFSSSPEVPAWEILEAYGVLGAPIGAWRSSRCC